jgi:hypothetical protein
MNQMTIITALCEQLADAHEAKGIAVRSTLQPGLDPDFIRQEAAALGLDLPNEIVELYAWRNGHGFTEPWQEGPAIFFRDTAFLSFETALAEYRQLQAFTEAVKSTLESDNVDLKKCLPISQREAMWHVVSCGKHLYGPDKQSPVVSVYHGVDLYFHSVESMLKTCIDWVSHPDWNEYDLVPEGIEMEIWRRHNPGIFPQWPHM